MKAAIPYLLELQQNYNRNLVENRQFFIEQLCEVYRRNHMFDMPAFAGHVKQFHIELADLCEKAGYTKEYIAKTFIIDENKIYEKGKTYSYADYTVTYDLHTGEKVYKLKPGVNKPF